MRMTDRYGGDEGIEQVEAMIQRDGFSRLNSTSNSRVFPPHNRYNWRRFTLRRPTDYDDPSKALSRLKHTTTVTAYQEAFEKLSHMVDDLPENFLVGSFIAGLKDEIRLDVRFKQLMALSETISVHT
ncbi:hypothetical protein Ddye_016822 [Dipteronia dyeriana]|uniref:Retrotransposon gag domain-containing protein n=1 Tax=Dipteronia dyeriana TaxID=168575 RepID=A0AAD9U844_9ROSI|nr:hypothetical protein Ddye_016822 [Dipteronia dyeriana]